MTAWAVSSTDMWGSWLSVVVLLIGPVGTVMVLQFFGYTPADLGAISISAVGVVYWLILKYARDAMNNLGLNADAYLTVAIVAIAMLAMSIARLLEASYRRSRNRFRWYHPDRRNRGRLHRMTLRGADRELLRIQVTDTVAMKRIRKRRGQEVERDSGRTVHHPRRNPILVKGRRTSHIIVSYGHISFPFPISSLMDPRRTATLEPLSVRVRRVDPGYLSWIRSPAASRASNFDGREGLWHTAR